MELKHLVAVLATSVGIVGTAYAGPASIYNPDNPTGNTFTNIDWSSNGTAFTAGFQPMTAGSNFTLTYFANANSIYGGSATYGRLDGNPNATVAGSTYEYTVVATLQETLLGCNAAGACSFVTNGGSFNVYYDANSATFANNALGTGFTDGTLQLAGTIAGGATSTFTISAGGGLNVTSLTALINYTDTNAADPAHITPALASAQTITTLQFGSFQTASPAQGYAGAAFLGGGNAFTRNDFVFQADGNSAFVTAVPEPGSVALLGIGAAVLTLRLRRRKSA